MLVHSMMIGGHSVNGKAIRHKESLNKLQAGLPPLYLRGTFAYKFLKIPVPRRWRERVVEWKRLRRFQMA